MVESADGSHRFRTQRTFVLIEEHSSQPSARTMNLASDNVPGGRLTHHLREDFEIGDPKRAMGFEGGDNPTPGCLKPLCWGDVGRHSGL